MQFMPGMTPVQQMTRQYLTVRNTGDVFPLANWTLVCEVEIGPVYAGDRILVNYFAEIVKGGVAGDTLLQIQKNLGAANIVWLYDRSGLNVTDTDVPAAGHTVLSGMGMAQITGDGALQMAMYAKSAGSNGSMEIGAGQMAIWVLPGS